MNRNFSPPPPNSTMEENIRFLIQCAVDTNMQLKETNNQLQETKALLTSNQARIASVEETVSVLQTEVRQLKEIVNVREQQSRNLTVRIHGLPVSDEELNGPDAAAAAAKNAYERIVCPLLSAAKSNGKIPSTPSLQNAISKAYRSSKPSANSKSTPPPIIVHLPTPAVKTAILIMRKDSLPKPTEQERNAGIKRFYLSEDLTPPTHSFLRLLKDDKRTSRVWSVDGQIRFTKEGDRDNFVYKVKSVFDPIDSLF
jgi:hypothetical protein